MSLPFFEILDFLFQYLGLLNHLIVGYETRLLVEHWIRAFAQRLEWPQQLARIHVRRRRVLHFHCFVDKMLNAHWIAMSIEILEERASKLHIV